MFAGDLAKAVNLFAEASRRFAGAGLAANAGAAAGFSAACILHQGQLEAGRRAANDTLTYSAKHHYRLWEENASAQLAGLLLLRCEFEAFEELAESRTGDWTSFTITLRASRAEMQGDQARALEWLPDPAAAGGAPLMVGQVHGARARLLWNAGQTEQARAEFALMRGGLAANLSAPEFDGTRLELTAVGPLDEALVELADDGFLRSVLAFARARSRRGPDRHVYDSTSARCILRVFAGVALHLAEVDEAESWYLDALEWCQRERCPIEAGRCHQGLAEVAERRGDLDAAREHLDAAGELFARHGAKLYLDQVLAKKEILRA
jgi:tetratricopeptide (TPR) repeat protein